MSLVQIDVSQGLESLSAEEANWWKKASPARREAYIKKHPKSKYANAVKSGKLKINSPTDKSPSKKTKAKTTTRKTKASPTKSTKVKAPPKKPEKKEPVPKSRNLRAQESVISEEEQERSKTLAPIVRQDMQQNFSEIKKNKTKIVDAIKNRLSPRGLKQVKSFGKNFLQGKFKFKKASEEEQAGARKATKILDAVSENLIGRQRYNSTGKTVGHILLSMFMGPTNYKELRSVVEEGRQSTGMESTSTSRKQTEESEFSKDIMQWFDDLVFYRMASLSAEEEDLEKVFEDELAAEEEEAEEESIVHDTIDKLITSYMDWMNELDFDIISQKIALLQARYEMMEEDWKPTKEAIDSKLEDDEDEELDIPSELETLDSESASTVTPRISFRVCPTQKRTDVKDRTRFDVMFANRAIGSIESDPKIQGNGKSRRSWVVKLFEGFNESAFRSGRDTTQPYTVVNSNQVVLLNPIRQTHDECKSWIKHVLERKLL